MVINSLNRGVDKKIIFNIVSDKEKFLEIVCEVSARYENKMIGFNN